MNKEKEENVNSREEILINNFNQVGDIAKSYLKNKNFIKDEKEIDIKDVIRYRKQVELIKKDSENKEKNRFYLYVVEWEYTNPNMEGESLLTELEFLVEEDENGNIVNIHTIEDLMKEYEGFESIKDVVDKTKENEEKPEEEQEEELKKDSLKDLEREKEEKEQEEKDKSKKEKIEDKGENKKRKPQRILETVNPEKAKVDYWHTLKQAFGLPHQVAELAFAYPISSEDKVDYANITIYMLDNDGNIIDGLDVDNYFEFDSSTGNNPINDKTARYEKDENRGQAQLDENNTMIRLKAVHPNAQHNTYISIEQINKMGDYRDINVGRQTLHTTDFVEKQVVTDRVRRDFDSEAEELFKSNGGQYKLKDIYQEAEQHKEHGDSEIGYVNILDADGEEDTFICVEEKDWKELAIKWGYYKDGKPNEEKAKQVYEEYKYNNPHLSDEQVVQKVSDDLYEQMPSRNNNR